MTRKTIEVTYYYNKPTKVITEHIDIYTGKEIKVEETIGHIGDKYETNPEELEGYDLVKENLPENAEGKMQEENITVKYYYKKKAQVIVEYLEKETENVLSEREKIEGHFADTYKTEAKDIKWYKLVEIKGNPEGEMQKEETKITYYYEKQEFNTSINKAITKITVNGTTKTAKNGKLEKVEIHSKDIETSNIEIEYAIEVKNTGEIDGKVIIEENIPEGLELVKTETEKQIWQTSGNIAWTTIELSKGETKVLPITLKWTGGETNFGTKTNIAKIQTANNEAGYEETSKEDNEAKAELIITIKTGLEGTKTVLITGTFSIIIMAGIMIKVGNKRKSKKARRMR